MNKLCVLNWAKGISILVILTLWTAPGFCDNNAMPQPAGPGFHIMALTRAVAEVPMFISFNGISERFSGEISDRGDSFGPKTALRLPLSGASTGLGARLAEFKSCLFQYIQVSGMDEFSPSVPGFRFPGAAGSGLETTGTAGDISLEFQADVADMSGALFFVLQL